MKHIRNILLLITIIFAFVMQAEVYQNMLWNFNGAYYLSSRYTTTNDDMDSFLANAEDTAEKHGVHIFSTFNQRVSNYQTRLYIYGDDTVVRDSLKSTMDIEEKTYTALIGGITVIEFEDFSIAGSSPEVMIRLVDGHLLLRPIAGTRKRGSTLEKDLEMENELINDKKERAEHLMLVDLGRNDVGRVARAGSVKVTELMRIERYSHVMHIVSDVEAVLDEKYDMFDLFMATFTAGTMTGAPKIRAMELIANFEKIKRNFYSGSIAYFGFDGNMDSAITIRTSLLTKDKIIFQSGAGIVADSINEDEYLEVHNKLAANIATLKDLL